MIKKISKNKLRQKRHLRIRHTLHGTSERPRLSVYRSNTNIYAQLIDDVNGVTLASASSIKDVKGAKNTVETASKVGKILADKALKSNIKSIVFDRSGYLYHGRVKALAEAAREAGLEF
jgi:large subunit ribosomal protein L18